jgi:hypothetical protein
MEGFIHLVRREWDRIAGFGAIAAGGLALVLGYVGVSGTAFPAEQLPYIISGGLGGIFLLGLGALLLLSADLRDEWRKLDRIEEQLATNQRGVSPQAQQAATGPQEREDHEVLVSAAGGDPRNDAHR